MKYFILLIFSVLFFVSCKNKEARVYEYSQQFNEEQRVIKNENIKQVKAYYVNKNKIFLDFIFDTEAEEISGLKTSNVLMSLNKIFEKNPEGKELVKEGVSIIVRLYNHFGIKVTELPLKYYDSRDFDTLKN